MAPSLRTPLESELELQGNNAATMPTVRRSLEAW
jgi:hypothetical protein